METLTPQDLRNIYIFLARVNTAGDESDTIVELKQKIGRMATQTPETTLSAYDVKDLPKVNSTIDKKPKDGKK